MKIDDAHFTPFYIIVIYLIALVYVFHIYIYAYVYDNATLCHKQNLAHINPCMQTIGIFFGGKSVEHDVSIVTAMQCHTSIKHVYKTKLIYITKQNEFYLLPDNFTIQDFKNFPQRARRIRHFHFKIDIALNCCHGGIGENGFLATLFSILNIPYTSASPQSAMLTMDKALTKQALSKTKIPTLPAKTFRVCPQDSILESMDYPVIVKPKSLGSSIGVQRCDDVESTRTAIMSALIYDDECIVEKCITPLVEYNCAIVRSGEDYIISEIEQPVKHDTTLSFSDKYLNAGQKGMKGQSRLLPAPIDDKLREKVEKYTLESYQTLNLKGVVRIDYLYNPDTKKLYLNEINTIPGSLAFYLFEPKGIGYVELVDIMLKDAVNTDSNDKISTFDSQILDFALHKN